MNRDPLTSSSPFPRRRWMQHGSQLSLGFNKVPPELREKHTHPQTKVAVVFEPASGVYTSWNVAGEPRETRMMGRQVYCVGADVPHAVHWQSEAPLIEVMLGSSLFATIPKLQVEAVVARELLEGAGHDPVLWELASKIRLLCSSPEQPTMGLLEPMAAGLVRRVFSCHARRYAPKLGPRLSEDRTQSVVDYMEEHLSGKIDADDLAKIVNLSTPHFTELFGNRTGKPPIEYLRELRRIKAHDMIFGGELRMSEIADACGFCDEPHLSREFRKFFGYTAKLLRTRGESA